MLNLLPNALQYLFTSLLWSEPTIPESTPFLQFELRHEHALSHGSRVVFSDVQAPLLDQAHSATGLTDLGLKVATRPVSVPRAVSQNALSDARSNWPMSIYWDEVETLGPDVQDRETLLMLAKMTNNAYYESTDKSWYDIGNNWNNSYPFGWEPDQNGFRGYVFATPDNSTVVVSIKGTSAGWVVGGGGPTTKKDKLNDNLLFSCCCARVGPSWSPVCDCYEGGYKCDQGCLERSLAEDSLFYSVGTNLYYNITYMYPNANIWLVGHSLGGSLASLVGLTFGAPVVAFEAPPERLAAQRLHLPSPPSVQHITHVYHNADPIPMGVCNGVSSTCAIAGFAFETKCHLGRTVKYDTVSELGWTVSIRTHSINVIIDKLLSADWKTDESGNTTAVPPLIDEDDGCVDCFNWEFGDYRNGSAAICA